MAIAWSTPKSLMRSTTAYRKSVTGKAIKICSIPSSASSGDDVYAHSTTYTQPSEPMVNIRSETMMPVYSRV